MNVQNRDGELLNEPFLAYLIDAFGFVSSFGFRASDFDSHQSR